MIFKQNALWNLKLNYDIISIPDEELFSETYVGCTASYFVLIIWCSRWFCIPLFWVSVLLYLRSPKGRCCSILDDLSGSLKENQDKMPQSRKKNVYEEQDRAYRISLEIKTPQTGEDGLLLLRYGKFVIWKLKTSSLS